MVALILRKKYSLQKHLTVLKLFLQKNLKVQQRTNLITLFESILVIIHQKPGILFLFSMCGNMNFLPLRPLIISFQAQASAVLLFQVVSIFVRTPTLLQKQKRILSNSSMQVFFQRLRQLHHSITRIYLLNHSRH